MDTEAGEVHPTQASMSWASQPLWPHLLSTGRCGNCGVRDKHPKGFQERWQRAEGVGERARKTLICHGLTNAQTPLYSKEIHASAAGLEEP